MISHPPTLSRATALRNFQRFEMCMCNFADVNALPIATYDGKGDAGEAGKAMSKTASTGIDAPQHSRQLV